METVNISLERFKKLEKDSHDLEVIASKDAKLLHIKNQLPIIEELVNILESSNDIFWNRIESNHITSLWKRAKYLKRVIESPDPKEFNEHVLIEYTKQEAKELAKEFYKEECDKLMDSITNVKKETSELLAVKKAEYLNTKAELQKAIEEELAKLDNAEEIVLFYQTGRTKIAELEEQKKNLVKELLERETSLEKLRTSQKELDNLKIENAILRDEKMKQQTELYRLKHRGFFRRLFNY